MQNIFRSRSNCLYSILCKPKIIINKLTTFKRQQKVWTTSSNEILTIRKSFYGTFVTKEENQEMDESFKIYLKDSTSGELVANDPEITKWVTKLLEYNVPHGKLLRWLILVRSYKLLEKPEKLTAENIQLAYLLGWCIQTLQSLGIITDDIIDREEYRRGVPCWYKLENVGITAINDAILMECIMYRNLRNYLQNHAHYIPILHVFQNAVLRIMQGQCLDTRSYLNDKPLLDLYTIDRFNKVAKLKTGYYSFCLPIFVSMYLSNIADPEIHRQMEPILSDIGVLFQAENDYFDCFQDAKKYKRPLFSDIEEGKCTWLIVTALEKASPSQKELIRRYYGSKDPNDVQIISNLFHELNIDNDLKAFREKKLQSIESNAKKLPKHIPYSLFSFILNLNNLMFNN